MNIFYGILLIIGIIIIFKNEISRRLFWEYFLTTSTILIVFYLIIDFSEFLNNIMGILFMAFFVSIFLIFIKKWTIERKIFNLYLSNNIDPKKVMANTFVLKNMSFEIARSVSEFDKDNKELLKFATESIKKIDTLSIPVGFPASFVAMYPDVLLWWNTLSDEKQGEILGDFDENNFLDKDKKINLKYLEIIVNTYKKSGVKLECLY